MSAGLVVYRALGGIDAIDEYSRRLVDALCDAGREARYVPSGLAGMRQATAPWILLQYNPFRFGRAGFAPRLVVAARALRAPLALMVHEAWTDIRDARSALIGGYQRLQLRALLKCASAVLASTQALARELGAMHLPVGSNVTPVREDRARARERLGLEHELVVALFGRDHPSRALDHAEAAVSALSHRGPLTVLNLGAGAPPLRVPAGVELRTPGRLDPDDISLRLHAADLLLLPLVDGVSTRRTTLMAALAHGLPVLGLRGANTDRILIEHPGAPPLTPAGDPAAFARAAVALAGEPERRRAIGERGRALYAERFDWPVLARRVSAELERL